MIKLKTAILLLSAFFVMSAAPAFAQETPPQGDLVDIIPASSAPESAAYMDTGEPSHPPIRLTPDKSELIRLDKKAGTIIVGNPAHLSVLADSAQTLVFVPRLPGATHIVVLDQQGEVLMTRHVIVASPQKKYVRIRKSCAGSDDDSCQATQVYYCPDMCHEIQLATEESGGADQAGSVDALTQDTTNINQDVDREATEE